VIEKMKKPLGWLGVLTTLGVLITACSHEIESPVPKAQSAEPDLVCNDKPVSQDVSTVVLHGENFTPMPSKTLTDKRELILPAITLQQTQALPGDDATTAPIAIADDPANPASSRVHWTSEQLMSFSILPEDKLATGVFTVTITNPDGKNAATIQKGLAVLPKPIVSELIPPAICDDQSDQTVTINGRYFLTFDDKAPSVSVGEGADQKTYAAVVDPMSCAPLDGDFVEKNVAICTTLSFTIPQGDFPVTDPTKVKVVVTNPAPADCASSEVIELTINPPPRVDAVKPATVCEGGSQITITGKGFVDGAKVSLDCMGTVVDATTVTVSMDGTTIGATFGPGAVANTTCDVIVQNPDGCQDRPLPHKTVNAVTGPILFFVDPPVVYNGINTRITLYSTTITPPLPADAVTIVPTGQSMPITQLMFNQVPNHPNRLQAIVPTGQAPGTYDITLKDNSGCFATLPQAMVVTADLAVTIKRVDPPFGDTASDTAISIFRDTMATAPADKPFVATPRVFLNPTNPQPTDVAVEIAGISFLDGDKITGVVPEGTPAHGYDVVLVNPDGSVGLLPNGFNELMTPPPIIESATPASIPASSGQAITLGGKNFDAAAMVSLSCVDAMGNPVMAPPLTSMAPVCNGASCTMAITVDGSALAAGSVCIARVTNPDNSYGEYSAIGVTTPSLNLNSPHPGTMMNVGRRALSAASGNATPAARFVYAIGGDSGQPSGALDSVEFAPVDLFGNIGAWTVQPPVLNKPRTLAGAVTVGRYIYLVGGDDGMGPVATAERALILSPRETPAIEDVDLALGMAGLDAGEWHYRVSAVFDTADTDNPGGESLPSDPFTLKLPTISNKKIAVTLVWKVPVDTLKNPLPNVAGYRIYRSPSANAPPGSEVLLATVMGGATVTFTDDGAAMPGMEKPLPTGSTGVPAKLPDMATKRSGVAVASGFDPAAPTTFYVYALFGNVDAATATGSYEYLPVTIAPNGHQMAGAAWMMGASQSATPRSQHGAWVVDHRVSPLVTAPDTYVYAGGGMLAGGTLTGKVEVGKIATGGDLGALNDLPKDFSSTNAGYGVCAANNQLFVFGGQGATPSAGAKAAVIVSPAPTLANNAWNSEGLSMTHGRYLMGSSVQSSFIFLLGGQTDEPSMASKTTELVIW